MSIPGSVNPLFLGAAGQATGGGEYQIERSVRFNSPDSAYLSRTPASSSNRKTWTWAGWVKRSALGFQALLRTSDGVSNSTFMGFNSSNNIDFYQFTSGSTNGQKITSAVFRDTGAWFHVVAVWNSAEATASQRMRLYINGSEITTFGANASPGLNSDSRWNSAVLHEIGGQAQFFNGYLADIHFIDGQALTPTSFGEFDTNGVWQPIDASELTYGTNGFRLLFSDNSTAAALGTDTSGNGNTWTVNNLTAIARDYLKDCTGTPFNAVYSFANMFDGSTGTYMTPITGTWATFAPSPAIAVTTLEIFGAWNGGPSLAPKINGIDITNAPAGAVYQWFTPTLTGGVSITSLDSFEFYTAGGSNAFLVSAIRINGNILITGSPANTDSLVDSPTNYGEDTGAGGEVRGNYATLNPLDNGGLTLSNGNLQFNRATTSWISGRATIGMSSGKWYWEVVQTAGANMMVGISKGDASQSSYVGAVATGWAYNSGDGNKYNNVSNSAYGNTYTTNDVIGVAFDVDSGDLKFYKNGTVQNSGTAAYTGLTSGPYFPAVSLYGTATAFTNFGQRPFAYTAPSGFKALCTTNLPEPTIADGSTVMDVVTYTGNGSTQTISGLNFDPDLVWIKGRSGATDHALYDTVRTATKQLESNTTTAETTEATGLTAFATGGFSLGALAQVNTSSATYAAWTWDAGTSTVTNTQGSITSQVRANASAGFSVVTYTGTSAPASIGHGLGVAPTFAIIKRRDFAQDWYVSTTVISGLLDYLALNKTSASAWTGVSVPSSTVFNLGTGESNNALGSTYVGYCFAPVAGYSSFGRYTGNGLADGPFVYTGFRPKYLLWKSTGSGQWFIHDTSRSPYNFSDLELVAETSGAEYSANGAGAGQRLDFLSNGFKVRTSNIASNSNGVTYIYAAFAEHPFSISRAR